MNGRTRRGSVAGTLFTGVMLIALGVAFLLDQMHVADFGDLLRRYWPMILVFVGAAQIMDRKIWNGLWLVALGAWFQAIQLGLFDMSFRTSWPLILIIFGAGIVLRALYDMTRRREPQSPGERHGS